LFFTYIVNANVKESKFDQLALKILSSTNPSLMTTKTYLQKNLYVKLLKMPIITASTDENVNYYIDYSLYVSGNLTQS
jgi:hypothetical protein